MVNENVTGARVHGDVRVFPINLRYKRSPRGIEESEPSRGGWGRGRGGRGGGGNRRSESGGLSGLSQAFPLPVQVFSARAFCLLKPRAIKSIENQFRFVVDTAWRKLLFRPCVRT
jgi:hypothetical protein